MGAARDGAQAGRVGRIHLDGTDSIALQAVLRAVLPRQPGVRSRPMKYRPASKRAGSAAISSPGRIPNSSVPMHPRSKNAGFSGKRRPPQARVARPGGAV